MKKLFLLMAVVIFAGLSGCCYAPPAPVMPVYTCVDYVKQLQKQGVVIIKTGETYTCVIPSESIFYPDSPNCLPNSD